MIKAYVYTNANSDVYGFEIYEHGDKIVCAAVSALSLNAVNSIERFCDTKFICNWDEKGGFLSLEVPALKANEKIKDVALLLNSFFLGILGIEENYPKDITIYRERGK